MKVKELEKWCDKHGGFYEANIYEPNTSDEGKKLFIDLNTYRCTVFPDYINTLKRFLTRNKLRLQYMYCSNGKIIFAIVKDIKE